MFHHSMSTKLGLLGTPLPHKYLRLLGRQKREKNLTKKELIEQPSSFSWYYNNFQAMQLSIKKGRVQQCEGNLVYQLYFKEISQSTKSIKYLFRKAVTQATFKTTIFYSSLLPLQIQLPIKSQQISNKYKLTN